MLSTNVNQHLAFRPRQRTRWVYEWGAQLRKYKISKSPYLKKPLSSYKTYNCPSYNQVLRKIFVPYTRLFYNTPKTLKTNKKIQSRPSSIGKTLTDCYSYLNAISTDDLECSLREAGEFKIIKRYYSLTSRESRREVINSYHWNYYFSIFLFGTFELPYHQSRDYPQLTGIAISDLQH
jgi:hypothetical protein